MDKEKLEFPVVKGEFPARKSLSMDDYIRFVNLHLKYTFNRKSYERQKRLLAVNVPFSF